MSPPHLPSSDHVGGHGVVMSEHHGAGAGAQAGLQGGDLASRCHMACNAGLRGPRCPPSVGRADLLLQLVEGEEPLDGLGGVEGGEAAEEGPHLVQLYPGLDKTKTFRHRS